MKIARVALAVPAVLLVAACGATSHDTLNAEPASTGSVPGPATPPDIGKSGTADGIAEGAPTGPDGTTYSVNGGAADAPAPLAAKAVISTGQVGVNTNDIDKARFELRKLLDTWGGSISEEESDADDKGHTRQARLVLRVPGKNFDTAMDALPGLGTLVNRSRSSQDVTTQVIDNAARVRTQKLSLARVQALLAKAKDLNQIIAIEEQLSQRQADLDSLEQQQKYLADQTAQATISLYLSRPDDASPNPDKDDKGFLAGLSNGWDHLGAATRNVLDATGNVIPFGLVLVAIVVPVLVLRRRRLSLR